MTKYTKPKAKVPYEGNYGSADTFNKPKEYICVNEKGGEISKDGKPLYSTGFTKCVALLLRNEKTLESALFHIMGYDLNESQQKILQQFITDYIKGFKLDKKEKDALISTADCICKYKNPEWDERWKQGQMMTHYKFREKMEQLRDKSEIKARCIKIPTGFMVEDRMWSSLLYYLGVRLKETILVNTKEWSLVYKPKEDLIYVDARSQKKVLAFKF